MPGHRRARATAWALAIGLGASAPASAGNSAMRDCVEQGGTYLEDGTCEQGMGEAARRCRKLGGSFRGGWCELPEEDPVERCKDAGGILLQAGKCYKPAER